jgi:hypothetical protein
MCTISKDEHGKEQHCWYAFDDAEVMPLESPAPVFVPSKSPKKSRKSTKCQPTMSEINASSRM